MSRCIAENFKEEEKCKFFGRSTVEIKCMHRIEVLDNHCDCAGAQKWSQRVCEEMDDELDLEFDPEFLHEEEEELNIDDLIEHEEPVLTCSTCKLHDRCHGGQNGSSSGMSEADKVKIASGCGVYQPMSEWEIKQNTLPF
jgi:hypothetical protein